MSEPIVINMPKDHLDFDIAGETFTASFADKSKAKYNAEIKEIEQAEIKNSQRVEQLQLQVSEKTDALDKRHVAQADLKVMDKDEIDKLNPLNDEKYLAAKQKLDRDYVKKFNDLYEKQTNDSKDRYFKWLDQLFGEGSGKKIYGICGESTTVLAKVVTQIITEVNKENDMVDYREKIQAQVADLKQSEDNNSGD